MPIHQSTRDYFSSLKLEFKEIIENLQREVTTSPIHDLRVNLKKQHAFYLMLQHLVEDFPIETILKHHNLLFKNSGKIRDIEVNMKTLKKAVNYQVENLEVEKKSETYKKKFQEQISSNLFVDDYLPFILCTKILSTESIRFELISDYFNELIQKINTFIENKKLHQVRIHLKELYYNYSWLHGSFTKMRYASKSISYINLVQHQLGQWHDLDNVFHSTEMMLHLHSKEVNQVWKERNRLMQALENEATTLLHMIDKIKQSIDSICDKEMSLG